VGASFMYVVGKLNIPRFPLSGWLSGVVTVIFVGGMVGVKDGYSRNLLLSGFTKERSKNFRNSRWEFEKLGLEKRDTWVSDMDIEEDGVWVVDTGSGKVSVDSEGEEDSWNLF
jgi:hypothetical protein